jgi:hypothetical protein
MNRKNDMSERFGKCRFLDRTEPAFAAVRKLHKKRFDLNEFTIKSGTSERMILVRLNHLRRVLQHSFVVEPNRFVSLGVRAVRLRLKLSDRAGVPAVGGGCSCWVRWGRASLLKTTPSDRHPFKYAPLTALQSASFSRLIRAVN